MQPVFVALSLRVASVASLSIGFCLNGAEADPYRASTYTERVKEVLSSIHGPAVRVRILREMAENAPRDLVEREVELRRDAGEAVRLRSLLDEQRTMVTEVSAQRDEALRTLRELRTTDERLTEMTAKAEKIPELEEALRALRKENSTTKSNLEGQIQRLSVELKTKAEAVDEEKSKAVASEANLRKTREALGRAAVEAERSRSLLEAEKANVARTNAEVSEAQAASQRLQAENATHAQKTRELQTALRKLQEEKQRDSATAAEEIRKLESELAETKETEKNRASRLEESLRTLQGSQREITAAKTSLERQIQRLTADLETQSAATTKESERANASLREAQEALAHAKAEVGRLAKDLAGSREELQALRETSASSASDFAERLRAMETKKSEVSSRLASAEAESEKLREKLSGVERQSETNAKQFADRLSALQEENAAHVKKTRELQAELENAIREKESESKKAQSATEYLHKLLNKSTTAKETQFGGSGFIYGATQTDSLSSVTHDTQTEESGNPSLHKVSELEESLRSTKGKLGSEEARSRLLEERARLLEGRLESVQEKLLAHFGIAYETYGTQGYPLRKIPDGADPKKWANLMRELGEIRKILEDKPMRSPVSRTLSGASLGSPQRKMSGVAAAAFTDSFARATSGARSTTPGFKGKSPSRNANGIASTTTVRGLRLRDLERPELEPANESSPPSAGLPTGRLPADTIALSPGRATSLPSHKVVTGPTGSPSTVKAAQTQSPSPQARRKNQDGAGVTGRNTSKPAGKATKKP